MLDLLYSEGKTFLPICRGVCRECEENIKVKNNVKYLGSTVCLVVFCIIVKKWVNKWKINNI